MKGYFNKPICAITISMVMLVGTIAIAMPYQEVSAGDPQPDIEPTLTKEITKFHPTGIFAASDECDGDPAIDIKSTRLFCVIKISYNGHGTDAIIEDTIPAGWQVVGVIDENRDSICDVSQANKKTNNKSATKITCPETDEQMYWILMQNRQTPNEKFLKPTSCSEDFPLNDGAVAFESSGGEKVIVNDLPVIVAVSGPLDPLPTVDPNDLDCDGVDNIDDMCPLSDPINLGPIDDWGCDRLQTDS